MQINVFGATLNYTLEKKEQFSMPSTFSLLLILRLKWARSLVHFMETIQPKAPTSCHSFQAAGPNDTAQNIYLSLSVPGISKSKQVLEQLWNLYLLNLVRKQVGWVPCKTNKGGDKCRTMAGWLMCRHLQCSLPLRSACSGKQNNKVKPGQQDCLNL